MSLQTQTIAAPSVEHVMDLTVSVSPIIDAGDLSGLGTQHRRRIVPITGGIFTGQIHGKVMAGGADFQRLTNGTTAELDARYLLELEGEFAGEHIFVTNRAVRRASADDVAKMSSGQSVEPSRVYFRCTPQFEVSHPKLNWLTDSIFIGSGHRHPTGVMISVYRLL
jgi:Protein of unknown function (DUF3237)